MPQTKDDNPLGPFVQFWLVSAMIFTLLANSGLLDSELLVFSWEKIAEKWELWRFCTSFCYLGTGLPAVLNFFSLILIGMDPSDDIGINTGGGGGTADFVFSLMFGSYTIIATYPFLQWTPPLFARTLLFFVWKNMYFSGRRELENSKFGAFPFFYLLGAVFTGAPYADMVHGLLVGQLYYFLAEIVPFEDGTIVLRTPRLLIDLYGMRKGAPSSTWRHNWGRGRPLGRGEATVPKHRNRRLVYFFVTVCFLGFFEHFIPVVLGIPSCIVALRFWLRR